MLLTRKFCPNNGLASVSTPPCFQFPTSPSSSKREPRMPVSALLDYTHQLREILFLHSLCGNKT